MAFETVVSCYARIAISLPDLLSLLGDAFSKRVE
jgi:hypothetical protein